MRLRERIAHVLEDHPELGGREPDVVGLVCSCCGQVAVGSVDEVDRLTRHWRLGDHAADADFCSECMN